MKRQIVSYLIEQNVLVQPNLVKKLEDPQVLKNAAKLVEQKAPVQTVLEIIEPKQKYTEKIKKKPHKTKLKCYLIIINPL